MFGALRSYGLNVLIIASLLIALELTLLALNTPTWIMPRPSVIWQSYLSQTGLIWRHLLVTGTGAVSGLLIGGVFAVGMAILMVNSPLLERILMPVLLVEQSIPKIALAPMLVIWFGTGMTSRVVIATVISFFPILITTFRGLTDVDPRLGSLMHSLAAGNFRMFMKVRLPNAVPYIFSGVRVAVPAAIIGAVVAEFVQSNAGLGFLILVAQGQLDMPTMFVCVAALACMSLLLYGIVVGLEKAVIARRFSHVGLKQ